LNVIISRYPFPLARLGNDVLVDVVDRRGREEGPGALDPVRGRDGTIDLPAAPSGIRRRGVPLPPSDKASAPRLGTQFRHEQGRFIDFGNARAKQHQGPIFIVAELF
jgi:hypothetical protein